jgi:hypothetical protein
MEGVTFLEFSFLSNLYICDDNVFVVFISSIGNKINVVLFMSEAAEGGSSF